MRGGARARSSSVSATTHSVDCHGLAARADDHPLVALWAAPMITSRASSSGGVLCIGETGFEPATARPPAEKIGCCWGVVWLSRAVWVLVSTCRFPSIWTPNWTPNMCSGVDRGSLRRIHPNVPVFIPPVTPSSTPSPGLTSRECRIDLLDLRACSLEPIGLVSYARQRGDELDEARSTCIIRQIGER